jgi:hypothetical protein
VLAHPSASWSKGDWYITVVALRNKYSHNTKLDLSRDLCGSWQAASLYPRRVLKPLGDKFGDSTTLFLISRQSFDDTMKVCDGRA